jgi:RimJ/RimL family protein N-acetyltransferase
MSSYYKCLSNIYFQENTFSLVPIREEDIQIIRQWRNDQIKILRQKELITEQQQIAYFEKNIWSLFNQECPNQLIFSYLENNKLIGYGGLVHINWLDRRAEISFLLDSEFIFDTDVHDYYFDIYLKLIQMVGFDDLKFHKLHAEIYDTRPHHIAILEHNNFVKEGVLREHVLIEGAYKNSILCGKLLTEYKP